MSEITRAFFIMLAGMGLVFFGMFLIWGTMVLLERIFKDKPKKAVEESRLSLKSPGENVKTLAAAAAVASAIAQQTAMKAASAAVGTLLVAYQRRPSRKVQGVPTTSVWLVSHRLEQINLTNQIHNRKTRGNHS